VTPGGPISESERQARELATLERWAAADPENDIPDDPIKLAAKKAELKAQLAAIQIADAPMAV